MDILQPNIRFDFTAASRVLPNSPPISNLEILQNFPRTAEHPLSFLEKFAEKIGDEFGFYSRYWCHKPWESMNKSTDLTSESLAIQAVQQLLKNDTNKEIHAFLLGSTTNKRFTGSQAAAVLGHLGIDAPAYDLKTGCSTSLSTLHLAYALMALGYTNV
ncbi:MAG: 3-oxoacyl-ACP synthase, partial [Legionella longbeachae]|nr:3-oxoacyl-ACP synthase [Legionella longbeachae]